MSRTTPGDGSTRRPVDPATAALYVLDTPDTAGPVASALLGVDVVRSAGLPRGTLYEVRGPRGHLTRIIVGTLDDPRSAARRDARQIVREGMAHVTPWPMRSRHLAEAEAEALLDRLVGATP